MGACITERATGRVDVNDDTIMVANRERTMNGREDATAGTSGCRRRFSLLVE